MTCEDCIHYNDNIDFCMALRKETTVEAEHCKYFKDRSKFIELPCNVGDMVYIYSISINIILSVKILEMEINNVCILYKGVDTTYNEYIAFTEKDVNNSIFLTKEQAEQALREREEE